MSLVAEWFGPAPWETSTMSTVKRLTASLALDQAVTEAVTTALAAGLSVDDAKAILERIISLLETDE
jgi:hypothetical protein